MAASSAARITGHGRVAARYLVHAAVAAPSVHNTQPWHFSDRQGVISLCVDPGRRLALADPAGREAVISCGAALFNLRLAMRHLGFAADVSLIPDPSRPDLLAEIRWGRYAQPTPSEDLLYQAITRRHTHRGPFTAPVPLLLVGDLAGAARQELAELQVIDNIDKQRRLAELTSAAERSQHAIPCFAAELARWAPPPGSRQLDGVPASACPRQPDGVEFATRDFAVGTGHGFRLRWRPDGPHTLGVVALLTTREDGRFAWLLAGQALQRLLLQAAAEGISAAFHTQPLELPRPRSWIRADVSNGAYPQMLLRLGRAGHRCITPRRPVADVLTEES